MPKTLETKLEEWLYLRKIYMGDADKALLVNFIEEEIHDAQDWNSV